MFGKPSKSLVFCALWLVVLVTIVGCDDSENAGAGDASIEDVRDSGTGDAEQVDARSEADTFPDSSGRADGSEVGADADVGEDVADARANDSGDAPDTGEFAGRVQISSPEPSWMPDGDALVSVGVEGEVEEGDARLLLRVNGQVVDERTVSGEFVERVADVDVRPFRRHPGLSYVTATLEFDDDSYVRSEALPLDLRATAQGIETMREDSETEVAMRAENGRVTLITGAWEMGGDSAEARAWEFLQIYAPDLWGIADPADSFQLLERRVTVDASPREVVVFAQRIQGVPVLGGQVRVQVVGSQVVSAIAYTVPEPEYELRYVDPAGVDSAVMEFMGDAGTIWGEPSLSIWSPALARGSAVPDAGADREAAMPVWRVRVSGVEPESGETGSFVAMLDAITLEVLRLEADAESCSPPPTVTTPRYTTRTMGPLEPEFVDGSCDTLVNGDEAYPICSDGDCTGFHPDMDAANAGFEYAHGWYRSTLGRVGYDGCNDHLNVNVGATHPRFAAWFSRACFDISVNETVDGTRDLTALMTHEFTHGVIRTTANLTNDPEPDAIEEGIADTFAAFAAGAALDREPAYVTSHSESGITHYSDFSLDATEHANGNIVETAFYRMIYGYVGGLGDVPGMSVETAHDLLYDVLRLHMTPTTTFEGMGATLVWFATTQPARFTRDERCTVTNALASVGMVARWDRDCDGELSGLDDDGVEEEVDNCPTFFNPDQTDTDNDGIGDVCDTDTDDDGWFDEEDNCVFVANPDQSDEVTPNGVGDACDDTDGDFVPDAFDECENYDLYCALCNDVRRDCEADPRLQRPRFWETVTGGRYDLLDRDGDGIWNGCDDDIDGDGLEPEGNVDRCQCRLSSSVAENADGDGDGLGAVCDNCPDDPNMTQSDLDGDGLGDTCDEDDDGDGVADADDNCPRRYNRAQLDRDGNGIGFACDDAEKSESVFLFNNDELTQGLVPDLLRGARQLRIDVPFCESECSPTDGLATQILRARTNTRLGALALVDEMGTVIGRAEEVEYSRLDGVVYEIRFHRSDAVYAPGEEAGFYPLGTRYSLQMDGEDIAGDLDARGIDSLELTMGPSVTLE